MFHLFVGGLAVALFAGLVATGPLPSVVPLLILVTLAVFAENRGVQLPGGAVLSAGFMLEIAAIIVFRAEHSLLGPMIVGMACGGIYLPDWRSHRWRMLAFNASNIGLATLASAFVVSTIPNSWLGNAPLLLLTAVPAALVFFIVEIALVGVHLSFATGDSLVLIFRKLQSGHLQVYPFAFLGVFLGHLYLVMGAITVPLFVVPILAARQTFASYLELKASQEAMVRTLIKALEAKDPYTSGHAERVAVYAQYMGEEMNFGPRRMERLRFAALMHDIGKLIVPNHILNKAGKLTEEEFARVRQHEHVSVEVLRRIDFLAPVAPSASGEFSHYQPDAKKSPIEPYIVHTADAYDAMTSTRSYRKALSQDVAFDELRKNSGKQFHPHTVDALVHAIEKRHEHHGAGFETEVHDWVVAPPEAGVGSAGLGDLASEDETQRKQTAT